MPLAAHSRAAVSAAAAGTNNSARSTACGISATLRYVGMSSMLSPLGLTMQMGGVVGYSATRSSSMPVGPVRLREAPTMAMLLGASIDASEFTVLHDLGL